MIIKKIKGDIKTQFLTIYSLEGFESVVNSIKLDQYTFIKKVTLKERTDFYENTKGMGVYEAVEYLERNEFMVYAFHDDANYKPFTNGQSNIIADKIIKFLRSYKDGKVQIRFFQKFIKNNESNTFRSVGFTSMNNSEYFNERFNYELKHNDLRKIKKSYQNFSKINFDNMVSLRIALNRFNQSYLKKDWEDKIIDLMICFEAIFLTEDEKMELNYKLTLRVSKFYSEKKDIMKISQLIKKSYGLRSEAVHGVNVKKREIKIEDELLNEMQIILMLRFVFRDCFQTIINKYNNKSLKEIIKGIDNSILQG